MNVKRRLGLLALICISIPTGMGAQEPDIRRDATVNAVEMVMPSVVNIATKGKTTVAVRDPVERAMRQLLNQPQSDQYEYISAGSGVVIDENGYVLTNNHVVDGADQIAVRFATGTNDYQATIVASDAKTDVALLKVKASPGEKFHAIKLARGRFALGRNGDCAGQSAGAGRFGDAGYFEFQKPDGVARRPGSEPSQSDSNGCAYQSW